MISTRKSESSRINGAKSRGPITAEGREKSSRNALKHGFTADNETILLDCEDPAQYNEFVVKLRRIHEPATPAEEDVFEEMVVARWRLRRMRTVELGLLNAEILAQQSTPDSSKPSAHLASAFRALADDSRSLALASRYESRLQRLYDRAYKTLRELQQARKSEPPEEPHTITVSWIKEPDEPELPNKPTVAANKEVVSPDPNSSVGPAPGLAESVSEGAPDFANETPDRPKT
jgi:hypothetical protein